MPDEAIVVEGLEKSYGSVKALGGVDFTARTGSVLGLLGPNGAGKTTAVRILATLLEPDGGSARVAGLDVVRAAPPLRTKIGLPGQYAAVDDNLPASRTSRWSGSSTTSSAPRRASARTSCSSASSSPTPPSGRPRRTRAACAGGGISRPRSSSPRR